jgi:hypothetical protein
MGDEIVGDMVTARQRMTPVLTHDQGQIKLLFILLLREGYGIYDGTYSLMEPK